MERLAGGPKSKFKISKIAQHIQQKKRVGELHCAAVCWAGRVFGPAADYRTSVRVSDVITDSKAHEQARLLWKRRVHVKQ